MQKDMVSIPSANMNGGLKAANNNGTVVGVNVAGTVLTNGQRVYLTPASSYLASRQSAVAGATGTGVGVMSSAGGATGGGNNANATPSTSATSVRYFSQFSKLQPVQQLSANSVGQRKLLNGDTMVLVNGSKPLIFTTPNNNNNNNNTNNCNSSKLLTTTTATTTTLVPNGNRVFINNQQQQIQTLKQQQQQLKQVSASVIEEQEEELQQQQQQQDIEDDDENVIEIKAEDDDDDDAVTVVNEELLPPVQDKPLCMIKGGDPDAEPELDIVINNVVCSFSVRCHLKLREIALNGSNVEYRRENGMVTMKLRRPYTTASIWSSGRITCTGATSEAQAKIAARRYARCLNKLGFPTHFQNFRIVNVLGTCSMPWAIKIVNFSERHRDNASYEPELHPGVTYKMREPKATLKIFSTGSITVTAASVNDVESAIQHIYPLVHEFRKQRSAEELQHFRQKQRAQGGGGGNGGVDDLPYEDSINFNTTAAHTKIQRPPGTGVPSLADAPITSRRRLEEGLQYHEMLELTQTNRCHIPIPGVNASNKSSGGGSSGGDNICANARRRATECWATKLQNKRPRYNDPVSTATTTAGAIARTSTSNSNSNGATAAAAMNHNNNSNSGISNRLIGGNNKPLVPVDVVLKQSSSRARNAAANTLTTTTTTAQTALTATALNSNPEYNRQTFSPSDFLVDDLIEEDDDDDMSMHF